MNKVNWFSRIMVVLLILLISSMIIYKYYFLSPIGEISNGIIVFVSILILLALSESFDNFSIGKIISLSKSINSKNEAINKLEKHNSELISHLISISNTNSQKQSNTTIYGLPPETLKYLAIQKAEEPEIEEENKVEEEETKITMQRKRLDIRKVEEMVFSRYIKDKNIDVSNLYKDIKIQAFQGIDPISDNSPIFDGYYNTLENEVFFELKVSQGMGLFMLERLYLMLNKIYFYRNYKKTNALLTLILVIIQDDDRSNHTIERVIKYFQPAINNGLLKIDPIVLNKSDVKEFYIE